MVKLRLTRTGKKNQPTYRLVAIQARTKRDGLALETLGFYNPRTKPSTLELNKERIQYWLKVGAQPTPTVNYLLAREKLVKVEKAKFADKPGKKATERAKTAEAAKESAAKAKEAEKAAAKAAAEAEKAALEEEKAETEAVVEAAVEGKIEEKVEANAEEASSEAADA